MMRSRYIGEFKASGFAIATALFLLLGGFLYSRFDFKVEDKPADVGSKQQLEIGHLEQRIDQLEKTSKDVQGAVQQIERQEAHSSKTSKSQNLIKP
jgi:TolA-binding protein